MKVANTAAAVKLATEHLICLHKALKLAGKISILTLEAASMLFKCFTLSEKIAVVSAVLSLSHAKAINITSAAEEQVLLFLKTKL